MGWPARLFGALRLPLIRNAYALYISSLLTAGLGIFYWALATNLFPAVDVGVGATLVSTLMFVSGISELNLHSMMYRFLPRAGRQSRALVSGAYLFVLASGLVLGFVTGAIGILLKVMPEGITSPGVPELIAFVGSVMVWNMFSLQDSVLAAMRLSVWVPVENVIFALLKLALLLVFVGFHPFGIFASWIVSAIAGVGVVSGLIFTVLLPRYRGGRITEPITVGGIVRYVGGDYVAGVLSTSSTSLMPILVFVLLGPLQSAYFYPVWLIAQMLRLAPLAMYSSLLVETAAGHADYLRDGRRVLLDLGIDHRCADHRPRDRARDRAADLRPGLRRGRRRADADPRPVGDPIRAERVRELLGAFASPDAGRHRHRGSHRRAVTDPRRRTAVGPGALPGAVGDADRPGGGRPCRRGDGAAPRDARLALGAVTQARRASAQPQVEKSSGAMKMTVTIITECPSTGAQIDRVSAASQPKTSPMTTITATMAGEPVPA